MKRWLCASLALLFYASLLPWNAGAADYWRYNASDINFENYGLMDNTYKLSAPYVDVRAYSTFALALTAAANKTMVIPSTVTLTDNVTIPDNVAIFIPQGGLIQASTPVTLTINGAFMAGFYQVFGDNVTVLFGNGNGTGAHTPVAFPQWWGAKPGSGLDCGPGITKATNSWAGRVFFSYGQWGIGTPIEIRVERFHWQGAVRTYSDIYPLALDISVGGGPNAMVINYVNITNGHFENLRFRSSFGTGGPWAFWSVNGGGTEAFINTTFRDLWISMGASQGFLHGDVLECVFDTFQWDGNLIGFDLGSISSNNTWSKHAYALSTGPMISATGGSNNTISNVGSANFYHQPLFSVYNGDNWRFSSIVVNSDPAGGDQTNGGIFLFDNSTRMSVTNFGIKGVSGYFGGVRINSSEVKISHGSITNANRDYVYTTYPLIFGGIYIAGAGNKVDIDDVTIDGGTDQVILESGLGGDVSIKNSTLKKSKRGAIASPYGAASANITLEGNTFVNASYDNVLVDNVPIIELWTSGIVKVKNNTIGILDNAATSTPSARYKFKGSGQLIIGGNNYPGSVQEFDNNSTQTPITYTGPNVGGTSNRSAAGAPFPAPLFPKEEYLNTTDNTWWKAHCTTDNTCWKALN